MVKDAQRREAPRLLVVAHGTAAPAGVDTTTSLVQAVAARRPGTQVDLCFLDLVAPRLGDVLACSPGAPADRPTVVVPLLLSTGYHVQIDIPAIVADRPHVAVARHLGPHPLLVDALADRLRAVAPDASPLLLAGAGSTRTGAAAELQETAELLAARLDTPVAVVTMSDDLPAAVAPAGAVVSYLLAEGRFLDTLRAVAGRTPVTAPLGAHPAVVELVWLRYDDAVHAVDAVDAARPVRPVRPHDAPERTR
jgi:sirohydrochlorin ferrochelatase